MHKTAIEPQTTPLRIIRLGIEPYNWVWNLQKRIQQENITNGSSETLILCQHKPVITVGRTAKPESLLLSKKELNKRGIELFEIERGGDMTFHGPGQLVAYPLLDLRNKKKDVDWYMRTLEQVVLETMGSYGVLGSTIEGKAGVWIKENSKIASIGVRISRWCTMHGLSINVNPCADGFAAINPCGFNDISITSMQEQGATCTMTEVMDVVAERITEHFGFKETEDVTRDI